MLRQNLKQNLIMVYGCGKFSKLNIVTITDSGAGFKIGRRSHFAKIANGSLTSDFIGLYISLKWRDGLCL